LPAADCASFGDRLLASIHQYRYQLRHPVTISIGFAWRQAGDSWHSLTSRADAELYRAKIGGRDRYCLPAHLQALNALPVDVSGAAFQN
jgi:PleD family two-component response regulator